MKSYTNYTLPFEATAQIKRYLDDILSIYDEWRHKKAFFLIEAYLPSEPKTPKRIWNNVKFWSYLERKLKAVQGFSTTMNTAVSVGKLKSAFEGHSNIIAIARTHEDVAHPFKTFGSMRPEKTDEIFQQIADAGYPGKRIQRIMPQQVILKVLDIEAIKKLRDEIELFAKSGSEKAVRETHRFIRMDNAGDFFIGKHGDAIEFKSKKARYYMVFVAIYKCAGGRTASVPYGKIAEHVRLYFKGKKVTKKDIQNDINNSIKHRYLQESTPDGKKIISADSEGKAIHFYNPVIE